jgi:hypothetical protein
LSDIQSGLNPFPVDAATGKLTPQLVLDVVVSNESMATLVNIDLATILRRGQELAHGSE